MKLERLSEEETADAVDSILGGPDKAVYVEVPEGEEFVYLGERCPRCHHSMNGADMRALHLCQPNTHDCPMVGEHVYVVRVKQ